MPADVLEGLVGKYFNIKLVTDARYFRPILHLATDANSKARHISDDIIMPYALHTLSSAKDISLMAWPVRNGSFANASHFLNRATAFAPPLCRWS